MIFWDSSAVVPLIVDEPASSAAFAIIEADPAMIVWWATSVECLSAVARRESDGTFPPAAADDARRGIRRLARGWNEVLASEQVREHARRLLRTHPLRAADALQLAAALTWAQGRPRGHTLCTFDARLAEATRKEGFELALLAGTPGST